MGLFPDVHFGPVGEPLDWRECAPDDSPDDDAELFPTPPDVVGILGFDPLELKGEAHLEWLGTVGTSGPGVGPTPWLGLAGAAWRAYPMHRHPAKKRETKGSSTALSQ
jgi:hypothetical protein